MLFCESKMEHSSHKQQLDLAEFVAQSKSQLLDVNDLFVGSQVWFTEVVGLQNWGIDSRKDVNHVVLL